jgi:hypothetical protein
MTIMLYRGIGHPWTAAPGWDQLFIGEDTLEDLRGRIQDALAKFWQVWFVSEPTLKAHLFKPTGAQQPWQDISWQGTPRGHGHEFKVGDEVYTDYDHGRVSRHKVVAIEYSKMCQTGVQLRVSPTPRGAGFVPDDPGRGPNNKSAVLDSAWFRKVI